MHYFLGHRSCENRFPPNAVILIPWTYSDVWECFGDQVEVLCSFGASLLVVWSQPIFVRYKASYPYCFTAIYPLFLNLLSWRMGRPCDDPNRHLSNCLIHHDASNVMRFLWWFQNHHKFVTEGFQWRIWLVPWQKYFVIDEPFVLLHFQIRRRATCRNQLL
jgi:hypothetical protein